MRDILEASRLLTAMNERRAELAAGIWAHPIPAPLEAIRELAPDETSIYDASGSSETPAAIQTHAAAATVDDDAMHEHDAAIVGTALARTNRPGTLLRTVAAALKPGGRALLLVPNRRSLFLIAGLAKNRAFTLPGAWPESGPGPVTLAEVEALLGVTGYLDITIAARIGEAIPPNATFPLQLTYDDVTITVHTDADLRDFLTIAYVVTARTPR